MELFVIKFETRTLIRTKYVFIHDYQHL